MKRRFTILTAALALLVSLAIPMGMWGQTTHTIGWGTASGDAGTYTNFTAVSGQVAGVLSFSSEKNNSGTSPAYNANASELRLYYASNGDGGSITITPASGVTITGAVMTTSTTPSVKYFVDGGTGTSVTASNSTYTISNISVSTSLKIQNVNTTNTQLRIKTIALTYTGGGTATYTVTYDCNGGTNGCPENQTGITAGTSITLAAAPTKTDYAFNGWSDGNNTYQAGASYTVNGNVTMTAQWELDIDNLLFYESFDDCNGTGGNDNQWSGSIASSTLTPDNEDWTFANEGGANKCAKFGTSSKLGSAQTPSISHTGNATLTFKAAAWNASSESTTLKLSVTSGTLSESTVTLVKGAWTNYTIDITGITTSTKIKFEGNSSSNSRFFLDEVLVVEAAPTPYITAENVSIAYNDEEGYIAYTINNEPDPAGTLTASVPQNSWLTIGTVGATVPFTCTANPTSAVRTETVTLTYTYNTNETVTKEVTVTQAGNPNIVDLISDINAINTYYTIRGTVVAVNARGCVIGDGTGYINFYNGYTAPSVAINDMVTVSGSMTSYGNIYQFSNNSPNTATITTAESSNYNGTPAITVITEIPTSTYSSGLHLSDYFQFEGTLTKSSGYYYVSVGEGQINIAYPSTTQQNAMNALENKTVRVKGYFAGINSSNYFSVMMESIEEVASTEPSVTVIPATISAPFGGADGTLAITYDNLPDEFSFDYYFCDADGEELAEDPDWINAEINENNNTYTLDYTIDANDGEARTAYIKVYTYDDNLEEVYAIVTVNQAQHVIDYAVLPFVWEGGERSAFDALNGTSTYGVGDYTATQGIYRMKLDDNNDYILVKTDSQPGKVTIGVKMIGGASTSTITIQGSADGETFTNIETLTISGAQNNVLTLETTNAFAANDRYVRMLFTKGSNVGVGPITIRGIEYTLTIAKHGATTADGGWHLIASPVASVTPSTDNGFIATTPANYDLYYFDQSAEKEWKNYKANSFNLVSGKGYLYANGNENGTTLTFTGTPYSGNGVVTLTYIENAEFAGFNLIGNPFSTAATINMPFYRMNEAGTAFVASTESGQNQQIAAMEGVFVYAYNETTSQAITTATFTASRSGNAPQGIVNLNVKHNASVVDNAIVRFDGGLTLPKFMFNEDNTKLYIPQNGKDYAIVSAQANGEMPVSFKASENGSYTLTVSPENVEMNYLHLIDNMTGMDIDLLQTPSYTFEASTRDYASRFRLVFAANNENGTSTGSATFAYYNGSEWVVANDGTATLQVVDMMGRIVSTQTVNGNATLNANGMSTGVYVMRLVNGNEVKTQKIVVR
jgi:uncharacterized repeat protein (TIGR02543 family)